MGKPGRPGSGGPTLRSIAERTGFGLMTVSRALGPQPEQVAESKRRHIQEVAAELGYRPNLNVRALRQSTGSLVGLLCERLDGRSDEILIGLHDALVDHGLLPCLMVIAHHPPQPGLAPGPAAIRHLVERRMAGIVAIIPDPTRDPPWLDDLRSEAHDRGIPVVCIGAGDRELHLPTIRADLMGAATLMVAHVHRQGAARATILGSSADDSWHEAIAQAITAEASRQQLPCSFGDEPAVGLACVATSDAPIPRLLGRPGPTPAWIAGSDATYCPFAGLVVDLGYRHLGAQSAALIEAQIRGATLPSLVQVAAEGRMQV